MTKTQATNVIDFILNHYDMVSQEEWFDFCELVIDCVVHDANAGGYARALVDRYPELFDLG